MSRAFGAPALSCRLRALALAGLALAIAIAVPSDGAAATREVTTIVRFEREQLRLEAKDGGAIVGRYPGATSAPAGAPDLPLVPVWIEVPAGMHVTGVEAAPLAVEMGERVRLAPVAPDRRGDEEPKAAVADPGIYGSAGTYPARWAELGNEGTLRGHQVACVLVAPARWKVGTGELETTSTVEVTLTLAPGRAAGVPEALVRRRVVREIEERFETDAARLIEGLVPAAATEGGDAGNGPAGPGPYQPTFRPTGDGSAVEYVIVTSAALAGEFERLATWKTQKGVQAAVRTVEWIDQMYPNGVDRAERIRFFIRDAYQNWGTLFVLLGGDTDVIPPRYGASTFYGGENIPADIYYGCLDGNWNADGNSVFGQGDQPSGDDEVDFLFDVVIGRAPVSTLSQTDTFIDKLLVYEQNPPASARYPASILTLAERLFPTTHGAELAEEALAFLPSWIRIVRMYEEHENWPNSIELTKEAAIDSINAGFGIVHHVGHGYRNTMSIGSGTLNNADSDGLVNGPRYSVVFAINCSSASIDFNSIGERWVKNPNGGSIIYIGTSRLAFVTASRLYQEAWFQEVWQDSTRSVGLATDLARAALIPGSDFDGPNRWNLMATTLLGDPEVDLYTNAVVPIQVTHPATVAIGSGPITVTVNNGGSPVAGATVTLWKTGETYVRAITGANGQAQLPVGAQTPGFLTLTVHKSYHRPYVATIGVTTASGPYVFVQTQTVDDDNIAPSIGDGDGQADAGETVELRVTLKNGGTSQVTGVVGTLSENDPENAITILQNTVNYGTLGAGGSSQGSGAFLIAVGANAPVAYQPVFTLAAAGTQGTWPDVLVLPLRRPYLEHYAHVVDDAAPRGNGDGIVDPGEQIHYLVTLRNAGLDRATGVTGTLRALRNSDHQPHPQVTVTDNGATFGTIAQQGQVQGDRFAFTLDSLCDPKTVLLELTLADALGPADLEFIDVITPAVPDSFNAFGSPTAIRLTWRRSSSADTRGYDIYRSSSPGGPFTRINDYTVDGVAAFEDHDLPSLTRYYYQVAARDSSYNESVRSGIISGTTNPPYTTGWPIEMGQQTSSSITVADLDRGSHIELFCGGDMQYAWHGDASEVLDGDDDPRTNGPFSLFGRRLTQPGFAATQAVGDVEGDGYLEVANVSFAGDSLFLWDFRGALMNGWPKTVLDDYNWGSPIMADLDANGDLEIVCWASKGGRLFAWHHTGQEIIDGDNNPSTNGVLARVTGISYSYGSPAVAQLDGDPQLEIVAPANYSTDSTGGVYAWNINGTAVTGWPFLSGNAGSPSQVSSSICVADVNRDGIDEVIFAAERDGGQVYVLNSNGTVRSGWPKFAPAYTPDSRLTSPVVADLDGDSNLDIIFPDTDGRLQAWDRNGTSLPGFPVTFTPDQQTQVTQSTPAVGDVDGDGELEILFGDEKGRLHAYNHDGTLTAGFPIQTNGEVRGTPALWDIDRDNLLEVALAGYDAQVYVWDVPAAFNPTLLPWPFFRHDTRNTGRYSTPVQQVGIADPPPAPLVAAAAFHPARPNPFNPATTLAFDVPGEAGGAREVDLAIYDVNGRLVRQLVQGAVETGQQAVTWDGRGGNGAALASGVYFARIQIGDFKATRKLTMLR